MKHIRIRLVGNESRLEYWNKRQNIREFSPVIGTVDDWLGAVTIPRAYKMIRRAIGNTRRCRREVDALADKEKHSVITLLHNKRRKFAKLAFEAKRPVSLAKHVGVEIEFVSSSSQESIAETLAKYGVTEFVELKGDSSVEDTDGDNSGGCDGDCREDCNCADCGETHYCDDETECRGRTRTYESSSNLGRNWEIRENCDDCETETITETNEDGTETTREISNCLGHCNGHSCLGITDHDDYECNCECNCNRGSSGHEIAIVARSSQIAEVVTKVCKVLAIHNAKVNHTCGLHVHLDMRGFDENRAFANLVKAQKLFFSMVPKSRFDNTYCRPNVNGREMTDYDERYMAINPQSYEEHETIEVRLHSGTINAVKINHWIKLLQKIAYSNRKIWVINKLSDLIKSVQVSPELLAYIVERIAKFKTSRISDSRQWGNFTIANDLPDNVTMIKIPEQEHEDGENRIAA